MNYAILNEFIVITYKYLVVFILEKFILCIYVFLQINLLLGAMRLLSMCHSKTEKERYNTRDRE